MFQTLECLQKNKTPLQKIVKGLYCRYDPTIDFESSLGGLRIFIPTAKGYINYNLVHSVRVDENCDMWRLGKAYAFDDNLDNSYELTPMGAEWDMALRLDRRADFIGGYAHGDERYTSLSLKLNGEEVEIESLKALTSFQSIVITVTSIGFDPDDSVTEVLRHWKEYLISGAGITLHQRIEWLGDYTLGSSYMAMMPPLKTLTDHFYTDVEPIPKTTSDHFGYVLDASKATVYGATSGITFSMSVPEYPSLPGGNRFLLSDNSGRPYNKMYFVLCKGADVSKGDVWKTATEYNISNGIS